MWCTPLSSRLTKGVMEKWAPRNLTRYKRMTLTNTCVSHLHSSHVAQHTPAVAPTVPAFPKAYSTGQEKTTPTATDRGELVYRGNVNKGVYVAKCISLGSSAVGLCLQPWLLSKMASSSLVFKVALSTATVAFVFITPFLLHFLCKRYVRELYFNKNTNTFTAVLLDFFARTKQISFAPEEIRECLANPFNNYEVGSQPLLLDTDSLRLTNPAAFVIFMGYDKPIDLDKYSGKPE